MNIVCPHCKTEFEITEKEQEMSIYTSKEKLKKIFYSAPEDKINEFYNVLNEYAKDFAITEEVQENFFLAQIVAETGNALDGKRENLNYTPSALRSTFSRYKNNPNWSERDGRTDDHKANQINIGNVAYADRLGNGDISSGDGYRFRGGGYFQLTGRINYDRMAEVIQQTIGDAIDAENVESEITTPTMGTLTAMAFWLDNGCYRCYDIDCVTAKINRYTDSYEKRRELYLWIASI